MKSCTKYNKEKVQQVHKCSKKPLAHSHIHKLSIST